MGLCFCCSPKAGARFVGISNVIIGIVGVFFGGILLVHTRNKESGHERPINATSHYGDDLQIEGLWASTLGCIFPSVLAAIIGLVTLVSVSKNNICMGRLAFFLSIILILECAVVFITLFCLGIHWLEIIPIAVFAIVQGVFLCVLQNFIKNELSIESV